MSLVSAEYLKGGGPLDVFVSYAKVDDFPEEEREPGWVTRLVLALDRMLYIQRGREGASIFMDHQLVAGQDVTSTLQDAAARAKTLLLFMSNGFLQSPWCEKELLTFLDKRPGPNSTFIVEMITKGRHTWHPPLQRLKTVQLWSKGATETAPRLLGHPRPSYDENNPYWTKVNEVAFAISSALTSGGEPYHHGNGTASGIDNASVKDNPPPSVWIAQPTEDLTEYWDLLKSALLREGVDVRPIAAHVYPLHSAKAFKQMAEDDMAGCLLLVQLLSDGLGPDVGEGASLVALQSQMLATHKMIAPTSRVLTWRSPKLDLASVGNLTLRNILTGASNENFEQFRLSVLAACGVPSVVGQARADLSLGICVAAGASDGDTCDLVMEMIGDKGHRAVQPPLQPSPDEASGIYQSRVDEIIQSCDAMIVVYGRESVPWVQAQYLRAQRLLARSPRRLWGALLDAPPPKSQSPRIVDRRVMPLDCRDGVHKSEIHRFLDALVTEVVDA